MDFKTWVEAEKGRSLALANHFKRTPAAVSQWKKNGVPVDLMKAVRDFTEGVVSLEEMVPCSTTPKPTREFKVRQGDRRRQVA
jgi:hypothetical protein